MENILDEPTPSILYDWRLWVFIVIVLIIILAGGILSYYLSYVTSPWLSDRLTATKHLYDLIPSWLSSKPKQNSYIELRTTEIPEPLKVEEKPKTQEKQESRSTWCFVGEDYSGRFCVKVPGPKSCTHDRSYLTEEECELTPAHHLPAGIQLNQSTRIGPLRDLQIK